MRYVLIVLGILNVLIAFPQYLYLMISTSPFVWMYPALWWFVGPLLAFALVLAWYRATFWASVAFVSAGIILLYPAIGVVVVQILAGLLTASAFLVVFSCLFLSRFVFVSRVMLASVILVYASTTALAPYTVHLYVLTSTDIEHELLSNFHPSLFSLVVVILASIIPAAILGSSSPGLTKHSSRPPSAT